MHLDLSDAKKTVRKSFYKSMRKKSASHNMIKIKWLTDIKMTNHFLFDLIHAKRAVPKAWPALIATSAITSAATSLKASLDFWLLVFDLVFFVPFFEAMWPPFSPCGSF